MKKNFTFDRIYALIALVLIGAMHLSAADRLLVIGDATWGKWSLDRTSVMLRDNGNENIFRYTGWLEADKEFKFLAQAQWDGIEYRNASDNPYDISRLAYSDKGSAPDYKFKVGESANYTITCDLGAMTVSVVKADYQQAPILHDVLYLVGSATPGEWALWQSLPIEQDASNPFRFSGTVSLKPGTFKIATNCYADYNEQKFFFRDPSDNGRISEDGTDDRQWTIDTASDYNVTVDLSASTISIEPVSEQPGTLGAYRSRSYDGNSVVITAENGTLTLTPYNDYVVKVFPRANGDNTPERRSISVYAAPEGSFSVSEDDDNIVLRTSATAVTVSKADCRVSFSDMAGRTVLREKNGLDNSRSPRTASFEGMNDEAFYGGGYNGKRINHNGTSLVMNNRQTGGWDCDWDAPHNICIPFVVSTGGYGLYFDDHHRNARISPSSAGTTYYSGSATPIAYYYIGSADGGMASVLENYTFLTGRQELPPYWALGYMTSRYGYHSQQEAEEVVASVRKAGLPLDAIVFDLYWQGEGNNGMGNLDWYAPKFPDAKKMMSDFASKGVKTICITEPFFTSDSRNYSVLKEKGYFADDDVSNMWWLGSDKVGLIDSSNPAAMDWMWQFYKQRTEEGMGGWWLDLGEPESHDDDSHHVGGTVDQVHNEFGDLWTSRVYRGYKEDFPDVRPFLMPRAGTAGMQRYSTFPWSGDIKRSYKGLEAQIPALLSSGMSGVAYMGNDVGGFAADGVGTDSWLYLRWIEMATFSPMMRTHSTYLPEPYLPEYADVFDAVSKHLHLRYSFLPYTYTLAWENATKGTPLARPLNFHDVAGATPSPSGCRDQYLWGRDIMVAPVVTCNTFKRSITFPQGTWVDLNDLTKVYAGGSTVEYDVPLEKLPYFGRVGAFIPQFSQTAYTTSSEIDNTRLTVTYLAPSASASTYAAANSAAVNRSVMFEDDHTSTSTLDNGQYMITTFEGEDTADGHIIRVSHEGAYPGMPATRTYTFVVPSYNKALKSAGTDNTEFNRAASREAFDAAADNAFYLDADNTLYLKKVMSTGSNSAITVSSKDYVTGVDAVATDNCVVLEYSAATGLLSYSLPAGSTDATLTIVDLGGSVIAEYTALTANSTISQMPAPATAPGLYLATLSGRLPSGTPVSRTIKLPIH